MFGGHSAFYFPKDRRYISPADKLPRFEFSDAACRLDGFFLHDRQRSHGQSRSGKLGEILRHDELYRHYPEIAHAPFRLQWSANREDAEIQHGRITIHTALDGDRQITRRHICHEVQHLIQLLEGFSPGGDPTNIFNEMVYDYCKTTGRNRPTGQLRRQLEQRAHQQYRNLPGEKEARDVEDRLDWSVEQRKATPPVNSRLAGDATGVTFVPRHEISLHARIVIASFAKLRRQLT